MNARRVLALAALVVSTTATLGSLSLSGIGPLGWSGLGLFPCELCWYQRILMYPIPLLVLLGLARRDRPLGWTLLPLAVPGLLVALYHVVLQAYPTAEVGACFVGSCTTVDWRFRGLLTAPQLSLLAFALLVMLGALDLAMAGARHDAGRPAARVRAR